MKRNKKWDEEENAVHVPWEEMPKKLTPIPGYDYNDYHCVECNLENTTLDEL